MPAAASLSPTGPPVVSRLAGNPKLAAVVRRFAESLPAKLADMEAALAVESYVELAGLAHWLKGGGGSVGYDEFFEPSLALEKAARQGDAAQAREHLSAITDLAARLIAPPILAAQEKPPGSKTTAEITT